MILEKKHLFCFFDIIILILITLINSSQSSLTYPSYGDCNNYHGTSYIKVPYDPTSQITLDGIPSESFWSNPNNIGGIITIPTAKLNGNMGDVNVTTLNFRLVRNNQDLFILCEWVDNTTKPDLGFNIYDGLFFCWNINVPNFSAYYVAVMQTGTMGGGKIDSWSWTYDSSSSYSNHSSYYCVDKCITEGGWYINEQNNVRVGLTYYVNHSYCLEFKRALITNEEYDTQFDLSNLHKFNIAVINDGNNDDHSLSWTYALDFSLSDEDEEEDEKEELLKLNFQFIIIIFIILSMCGVIIILYFKNKKVS